MALLVECPTCGARCSAKRDRCACGLGLKKAENKVYWIEYRLHGRKRRERIGPSKRAAEVRLAEVLRQRTEQRYIRHNEAAKISLGELAAWYLSLPEIKRKASYDRDRAYIRHLVSGLGAGTRLIDLNPGRVDRYVAERLQEPSPRHKGKLTSPTEVNKEVRCLKNMLTRAARYGKIDSNPVAGAKPPREAAPRERMLTQEEFECLLACCEQHVRPLVLMAYYMPMRRNEILHLIWDEVDLSAGFVRLGADRTKTKTPRAIPMHPRVRAMLESLPRGLHTERVFLRDGKPFDHFQHGFRGACRRAGLGDFVFHDLRHCAINNLRLAGNDFFQIMAASGHKTMAVFRRYNLVTEAELKQIKWHDLPGETGKMPTYTPTKEEKGVTNVS